MVYYTYMKLILAQGNPGSQYHDTRHNVGFRMLDAYAGSVGVEFTEKTKFHAYIAEHAAAGEKILLVKPTTFYNETGQTARALVDFYKLDTSNILVLHDDIALPLGTVRTRERGSSAGNNGIKSLNAHLGEDYRRARIGVHTELAERMEAAAFVLGKFTAEEQKILAETVRPTILEIITRFISDQFDITSYR